MSYLRGMDKQDRERAGKDGGKVARLERALVLAAYIVLRHGPAYAAYVDRLEKEVEAARAYDPAARARRILEAYSRPAGGAAPAPKALDGNRKRVIDFERQDAP